MAVNYVKFQRGSQEAYDALKSAGRLDEDTLYFIYNTDDSSVGALYMGTRIISGGNITITSARLDDLADVIVTGAGTDSFLVKGNNGNWIAKSLEDVVALIKENLDPDLTNLTTTVANLNQLVTNNKAETDKAVQDLNNAVNALEAEVDTKVDKVYYTVPALDENGDPILDSEGNPTTKQVEGTLLSPEDKEKLSALVIDEDGSVGISGTVNASNVEGLGSWITENGTTHIKNLTEDNLSANLKDKINFITSVDNANFNITNGNLELKEVAISQVTGLQEVLDSGSRLITNNEINLLQEVANGKYNNFITGVDTAVFAVNDGVLNLVNVPTAALGSLGDFTKLPNAGASSLIDEINNLYNYLTWTDIP